MDIVLRKSLLNSYLIGLPMGLSWIGLTILVPTFFTNEGLLTMIMLASFGKAIIGLSIAFLFSLWIGAIVAKKRIENGDKLILTSFKYSTIINFIIWTVFGIIAELEPESEWQSILISLMAFIICTVLTTISIGLVISHRIRAAIKNMPGKHSL